MDSAGHVTPVTPGPVGSGHSHEHSHEHEHEHSHEPCEEEPDDTPDPDPDPSTNGAPMPTKIFKIAKGQLGFSLTDPGKDIATAKIADYEAFSCSVTKSLVTASSNFETESIPATMCDPAEETITPSAATFTLEADVLQDPDDDSAAGLAQFLWDNDSGVTGVPVWFYVALAEDAAPKISGKCYLSPQDFGGEPGKVLTASLSFPCEGRPTPLFGAVADV